MILRAFTDVCVMQLSLRSIFECVCLKQWLLEVTYVQFDPFENSAYISGCINTLFELF
jgi:hypothetical protein